PLRMYDAVVVETPARVATSVRVTRRSRRTAVSSSSRAAGGTDLWNDPERSRPTTVGLSFETEPLLDTAITCGKDAADSIQQWCTSHYARDPYTGRSFARPAPTRRRECDPQLAAAPWS